MNIAENIQRITGGKSDIKTFVAQKNMGEIPTATRIDDYAQYLNDHFPNFTYGITYDGTKIRGKTEKWNQLVNGINDIFVRGVYITHSNGRFSFVGTATGAGGRTIPIANYLNLKSTDKILIAIDGLAPFDVYLTNTDTAASLRAVKQTTITNIATDARVTLGINVIEGVNYNYSSYIFIVNLTDIFGAGNEPTSVDDEIIQMLIAYAKDHPKYDIGSLRYAYYKGTKLGQYDYIDTSSNILHIGGETVDLGIFTWLPAGQSVPTCFYTTQLNNKIVRGTTNTFSRFLCYRTTGTSSLANLELSIDYGGNIQIRDDEYTNSVLFKESLKNTYMYYELKTPIEIPL